MTHAQILLGDFLMKLRAKQSPKLYYYNLHNILAVVFDQLVIDAKLSENEVLQIIDVIDKGLIQSEDKIPPTPNYLEDLGL